MISPKSQSYVLLHCVPLRPASETEREAFQICSGMTLLSHTCCKQQKPKQHSTNVLRWPLCAHRWLPECSLGQSQPTEEMYGRQKGKKEVEGITNDDGCLVLPPRSCVCKYDIPPTPPPSLAHRVARQCRLPASPRTAKRCHGKQGKQVGRPGGGCLGQNRTVIGQKVKKRSRQSQSYGFESVM